MIIKTVGSVFKNPVGDTIPKTDAMNNLKHLC